MKDIVNGDNFAFQKLLDIAEIRNGLKKVAAVGQRKARCSYVNAYSESLLQLWEVITRVYPKKVSNWETKYLPNDEILRFLFSRRIYGRVIDALYKEIDLVKKTRPDGKTAYTSKFNLSDQELDNIPDNEIKANHKNAFLIWDTIKAVHLQGNEYTSFVLYWDLDMEPLNRVRGRWSVRDISTVIKKSTDETQQVLNSAFKKVKEYVQTNYSIEFHWPGEHN